MAYEKAVATFHTIDRPNSLNGGIAAVHLRHHRLFERDGHIETRYATFLNPTVKVSRIFHFIKVVFGICNTASGKHPVKPLGRPRMAQRFSDKTVFFHAAKIRLFFELKPPQPARSYFFVLNCIFFRIFALSSE